MCSFDDNSGAAPFSPPDAGEIGGRSHDIRPRLKVVVTSYGFSCIIRFLFAKIKRSVLNRKPGESSRFFKRCFVFPHPAGWVEKQTKERGSRILYFLLLYLL